MDRMYVARVIFNALWNINTENGAREKPVSIKDLAKYINSKRTEGDITDGQIIDALENDPYRRVDMAGNKTNERLFLFGRTDGMITSVVLTQHHYENHREWGII